MSSIVIILGAGSSAPFGIPILREMFKNSNAMEYLKTNHYLRENLEKLFLEPRGYTLETSHLGLTIEDILTIIRDIEKGGYRFTRLDDFEKFKRGLYLLIKKSIYDDKTTKSKHLNPLIELADKNFDEVTWATFNWDCVFESSFFYLKPKNEIRENPKLVVDLQGWPNNKSKHTFLKLHGGLNWWFINDKMKYLRFGSKELNQIWVEYEKREGIIGYPIILEPSYYKYNDSIYDKLKPQWDYLIEKLKTVDIAIIIGYSLPESDSQARFVLTFGFQYNSNLKYIVVNDDENICSRYKKLFGNNRLKCISKKFETLNNNLSEILK